jgi:flagellar assembly factor FliW
MPAINIYGTEHFYQDDQVIEFAEGLIGMPRLRRAAIVAADDFAPFFWLASVDDEDVRFIVVDPTQLFADYHPEIPEKRFADHKIWAIVKVSSDWQKTTVNLRAPIFVNEKTQNGKQSILTESDYRMEQPVPLN